MTYYIILLWTVLLISLTYLFTYVSIRAVELRPDLSCLWKLLGDACTAVSNVSPHRAQVLVPAPLAGLDPSTQNPKLNQAQALKVGERYEHKQPSELTISSPLC